MLGVRGKIEERRPHSQSECDYAMQPLIQFENVQKVFNTKSGPITALSDVSFHIEEDTFTTVVGPSGCGKSTLLKMCAGLMPPSDGCVKYRGVEVSGINSDVGLVYQDSNLFPWLTLEENVALPLRIRGIPRGEIKDRVHEYIALAKLSGFEKMYPFQLSGGMQKRGSIIRTMVYEPSVILMDEPFGSLDAQTRLVLHEELLRIWSTHRKTILFITHDLTEAVTLSDKIIVLSARPSCVKAEIEVTVPRPRDVIGIHDQTGFSDTYRELLGQFREELQAG
jgi:NitT/TauT family transport system ATP-binding protein